MDGVGHPRRRLERGRPPARQFRAPDESKLERRARSRRVREDVDLEPQRPDAGLPRVAWTRLRVVLEEEDGIPPNSAVLEGWGRVEIVMHLLMFATTPRVAPPGELERPLARITPRADRGDLRALRRPSRELVCLKRLEDPIEKLRALGRELAQDRAPLANDPNDLKDRQAARPRARSPRIRW